jgi:hypothetical protein
MHRALCRMYVVFPRPDRFVYSQNIDDELGDIVIYVRYCISVYSVYIRKMKTYIPIDSHIFLFINIKSEDKRLHSHGRNHKSRP